MNDLAVLHITNAYTATLGRVNMFKFLKSLCKKKVLVYSAFGEEDYFRIAGKLRNHGVKFETHIPNTARLSKNNFHFETRQYYIYVKEEDEHNAVTVIHTTR